MKKRLISFLSVLLTVMLLLPICAWAGEPSSAGDGLIPETDFLRLCRWIDNGYGYDKQYEDVVAFIGVEGKDKGHKDTDKSALGDHYFDWISAENPKRFIHVCFRGDDATGAFVIKQFNTGGVNADEYATADLTDWLAANACLEMQPIEHTLTRFKATDVHVKGQMPVRGWIADTSGAELKLKQTIGNESKYPSLIIAVEPNQEGADRNLASFTNLAEAPSRTIAGMEMTGRTYTYQNKVWTEYNAALSDTSYICIKIETGKININEGTEGGAILDSLSFE
ncbi:MAG: hypothetical protein Q4C54_00240 [Clostridia bacterium]|nr:hypothetical protein [Clostridia bacterium]